MQYLQKILGIGDVKEIQSHILQSQRHHFDDQSYIQSRHFENQTDLLCKALAQIAVMRGELEKFRTEFDHFSANLAWGQNPHDEENGRLHSLNKKKASVVVSKLDSCTLEKENTQYKAIMNFLQSREKATVDQIYRAVKGIIYTQHTRGKRSAILTALSRLKYHGFVKRIGHAVYQVNEGKKGLLPVVRQKTPTKDSIPMKVKVLAYLKEVKKPRNLSQIKNALKLKNSTNSIGWACSLHTKDGSMISLGKGVYQIKGEKL